MEAKAAFKEFCKKHQESMPFSLHYNWWNEVVKDNWDVAIVQKGDEIHAVWPYLIRKKGVWKLLAQPHFTAYTGPFLAYPEGQKESSRVAFENKTYQELIDCLPKHAEFLQKFNFSFHNSLAFHWNGFEDKRQFTYIQDLDKSEDQLRSDLSEACRRQIKKAEKTLKVEESNNEEALKRLMQESYKAKKESFPIDDKGIFERIQKYLLKYNCGKILDAIDKNGDSHAMMAIIWDAMSAYYIIGGSSEDHKNSGAMSLLLWEGMLLSKRNGIVKFNFEGSSVKTIEKFLRAFGGRLTSYSLISRRNSKSLKLAKDLIK